MEFIDIVNKGGGKFLSRYDVNYKDGEILRTYEMFSRDPELLDFESLQNPRTDAVIIIAVNKERDRLLLLREFRMELGKTIYGLPAGLIDPGESFYDTAKRELFEETGVRLSRIIDILPPSYCAVGLSNEQCVCVFCEAEGEPYPAGTGGEEIDAKWFSKEELKELLRSSPFGSWAQAYSFMWVHGMDFYNDDIYNKEKNR
ncbi:MAG: NUDIX hydrolase [Ruminococcaceae bacterium]|nr:NUDIX hydrolase [Oscillospiraceae bacterium]